MKILISWNKCKYLLWWNSWAEIELKLLILNLLQRRLLKLVAHECGSCWFCVECKNKVSVVTEFPPKSLPSSTFTFQVESETIHDKRPEEKHFEKLLPTKSKQNWKPLKVLAIIQQRVQIHLIVLIQLQLVDTRILCSRKAWLVWAKNISAQGCWK